MDEFIHIRSAKFPVLEGEEQELVNAGMYGKALGRYLQERLAQAGYECSDPFCEDWGWALFVSSNGISTLIGIYSDPSQAAPKDYACTADGPKKSWSWRRFGFVNTEPPTAWYARFRQKLAALLRDDPEIDVVSVTTEFPLG